MFSEQPSSCGMDPLSFIHKGIGEKKRHRELVAGF
jgi:hypothetical protein